MSVTEKIKILLIKKKLTAKELAGKLGCTSQNISGKMKRDNFSMNELQEIAQALDCSLEINFVMNDTKDKV